MNDATFEVRPTFVNHVTLFKLDGEFVETTEETTRTWYVCGDCISDVCDRLNERHDCIEYGVDSLQ